MIATPCRAHPAQDVNEFFNWKTSLTNPAVFNLPSICSTTETKGAFVPPTQYIASRVQQ
jgi:hypothetical protein